MAHEASASASEDFYSQLERRLASAGTECISERYQRLQARLSWVDTAGRRVQLTSDVKRRLQELGLDSSDVLAPKGGRHSRTAAAIAARDAKYVPWLEARLSKESARRQGAVRVSRMWEERLARREAEWKAHMGKYESWRAALEDEEAAAKLMRAEYRVREAQVSARLYKSLVESKDIDGRVLHALIDEPLVFFASHGKSVGGLSLAKR